MYREEWATRYQPFVVKAREPWCITGLRSSTRPNVLTDDILKQNFRSATDRDTEDKLLYIAFDPAVAQGQATYAMRLKGDRMYIAWMSVAKSWTNMAAARVEQAFQFFNQYIPIVVHKSGLRCINREAKSGAVSREVPHAK